MDPNCRIPQALAELKRRAPDVQPEVVVMTFANLNLALRERRLEVAIRGMYKKERVLNYRALFVEVHRVYSMAGLKPKDGQAFPLVYRSHPFVEKALNENGFVRGPDAGGLEAIGLLVATGIYSGLLPEHYAQLLSKSYALSEVSEGPVFQNTICAITEASRPLTRRLGLFLDILEEMHGA